MEGPLIPLLAGVAFAARVYDVEASGDRVAVARTEAIEVRRLDDGAVVHVLPLGETEVLAVATGGPWVVASTRTRLLAWRDGRFVAAWPWPDEHRRGMRVDPAGLVIAWGYRTVGAWDAATGEVLPIDVPDVGAVQDATADGGIADEIGVLAPSGAALPLGGGCRFGPGVVACDGHPAAVYALPTGERLRELPGDRVVAAGPAGFLTWDGVADRTRWVGRDGAVLHEVAGRWEGAVGAKGAAIVRGFQLCVLGGGETCMTLDAAPTGETVPAEGPAVLLTSQITSMAVGLADGEVRWRAAVGSRTEFGRADLPPGMLPGLLARADGWSPGPVEVPRLASGQRDLELRVGDKLLWRGAGHALGIVDDLALLDTPAGDLVAVGVPDGKVRWTLPLGAGRWNLGSRGGGLAIVWDGEECVLVDLVKGREVRRFRRPSPQHGIGGPLPHWVNMKQEDGDTAVSDARTGAPLFVLPGYGPIEGRLPDGGLVRRMGGPDDTALIEVRDGPTLRWRVLLDRSERQFVQAELAGDVVVLQRGNTVMALDGADGSLRWAVPFEDAIDEATLLE